MRIQDLAKFKLPKTPGVYFFKKGRHILYIGKATSLRDRVRSYFGKDLIDTRGPFLVGMVFNADRVSFKTTDSVLEALLLEVDLIKKHQPHYNTAEKDDKSHNCVVITAEEFPQLLVVRKRELESPSFSKSRNFVTGTVFGPFPHGAQLKEALHIIRRIFPYRDEKCKPHQGRPCFNRQLGLCPGVCTGEISAAEYRKIVRNIKLLFEGKKGAIIRQLRQEMKATAKAQEFERAGAAKRTIFALEHIHDIALMKRNLEASAGDAPFRIEAYDVAHLGGSGMVGALTVVRDGEPDRSEYRKFALKTVTGANEPASLREILSRRLNHAEWPTPDLIVVDGNEVQKDAAEKVLAERHRAVPVVAVVKDSRHKARHIIGRSDLVKKHKAAILLANLESHRFAVAYHRKKIRARGLS